VNVPAGGKGITVTANDVTLDGLTVLGAQSNSYNGGEIGIYVDAPAGAPVQRLTISNSEVGSFGGHGLYLREVSNLLVQNNRIHDIVYAGVMVLSGHGGRIVGNIVQRIGVNGSSANDGNAYGIALSRIVAGGNTVTTDFTVDSNTVEDVPTWHALDTHGGQRIDFTNNTIRRVSRAVFVTTDDGGSRPTDINVKGNQFQSPAPVTYNLLAVTTYNSVNVTVSGNTATGWPSGQFFQDYLDLSTGLVVTGNTIR
jgi:hypothetical protein